MPLTKIENIDHNSSWALWEINEPVAELLVQSTLSSQDDEAFRAIRHPKKSEELLAGRLAANALAVYLGIPYSGLYKDECNKPYLINSSFHISITHSHPYAAAVIHKYKPTGIDIEKPQPKLLKIAHKFLNPAELDDARSDIAKLCVYWCAKETLYKIYGRQKLLFRENLFVEPFVIDDSGYLKCAIVTDEGNEAIQIYYEKFSDYFISYCC